jgi:ELWxxDGT repeat protein
MELWKSDGTSGGTVRVKDINAGVEGSYPQDFNFINGTLYFTAWTLASGRELWKTDGSTNGTVMVKEIINGAVGGFETTSQYFYVTYPFTSPFSIGNYFYFVASDYASVPNGSSYENNLELWKSDGTTAGTTKVMDIYASTTIGSYPAYFVTALNKVFFTAESNTSGRELWTIDLPAVAVEEPLDQWSIYPNPAQNHLTISATSTDPNAVPESILVSDLNGKCVYSATFEAAQSPFRHTLDVSDLPTGMYLVAITRGDSKLVKKIVKM